MWLSDLIRKTNPDHRYGRAYADHLRLMQEVISSPQTHFFKAGDCLSNAIRSISFKDTQAAADLVRLPFPVCFFEFAVTFHEMRRIGVLCIDGITKSAPPRSNSANPLFTIFACTLENNRILGFFRPENISYDPDAKPGDRLTVDPVEGFFSDEIKAESKFITDIICSTLLFLNTTGVTDFNADECADATGAKKLLHGSKPKNSYHVVKISKQMKLRMEGDASHGNGRRQHWIRGHFKVRKTGVFWWNAHLAGNPDLGKIEKEYALN